MSDAPQARFVEGFWGAMHPADYGYIDKLDADGYHVVWMSRGGSREIIQAVRIKEPADISASTIGIRVIMPEDVRYKLALAWQEEYRKETQGAA